jgi:hypothetical protein
VIVYVIIRRWREPWDDLGSPMRYHQVIAIYSNEHVARARVASMPQDIDCRYSIEQFEVDAIAQEKT